MKNLNKYFIFSLMMSLLLHLIIFISITIDWTETFKAIEMGARYGAERVAKAFEKKEKSVDKVEEALKEMAKLAEEAMKNVGKGKFIKTKTMTDKKQGTGIGKEKGLGGGIAGFKGFIAPPQDKPIEVTLQYLEPKPIAPPVKSEVKKMEVTKSLDKNASEVVLNYIKAPPKKGECKDQDSYGGIGLQFAPAPEQGKSMVMLAPEGYPAALAGVQKGDIIEGDPLRFKGSEGSMVDFEVYRMGQKRTLKLKRVKVCYETQKVSTNPSKSPQKK